MSSYPKCPNCQYTFSQEDIWHAGHFPVEFGGEVKTFTCPWCDIALKPAVTESKEAGRVKAASMVSDTERLEWIAENSAAIRKGGEKSPDPYYFVIYRDGSTSAADNDLRKAIDHAIKETEATTPPTEERQNG